MKKGFKNPSAATQRAILAGYRSGLEQRIQEQLNAAGCKAQYEPFKIPYEVPLSNHNYTPDFVLENGIVIETKGRWVLEDRKKIALLKEQYPNLDLRMVFSNSNSRIRKGAKSRYKDVCEKLEIPYADKEIPVEWLSEKPNRKSLNLLKKMN